MTLFSFHALGAHTGRRCPALQPVCLRDTQRHMARWLFCGGQRIRASHAHATQRKRITDNHRIANCVLFHNVALLTNGFSLLHTSQLC
jgi:hypothetical protein